MTAQLPIIQHLPTVLLPLPVSRRRQPSLSIPPICLPTVIFPAAMMHQKPQPSRCPIAEALPIPVRYPYPAIPLRSPARAYTSYPEHSLTDRSSLMPTAKKYSLCLIMRPSPIAQALRSTSKRQTRFLSHSQTKAAIRLQLPENLLRLMTTTSTQRFFPNPTSHSTEAASLP